MLSTVVIVRLRKHVVVGLLAATADSPDVVAPKVTLCAPGALPPPLRPPVPPDPAGLRLNITPPAACVVFAHAEKRRQPARASSVSASRSTCSAWVYCPSRVRKPSKYVMYAQVGFALHSAWHFTKSPQSSHSTAISADESQVQPAFHLEYTDRL